MLFVPLLSGENLGSIITEVAKCWFLTFTIFLSREHSCPVPGSGRRGASAVHLQRLRVTSGVAAHPGPPCLFCNGAMRVPQEPLDLLLATYS